MQHKPKIMIVENEVVFVMSLERKLKTSGYHICESSFCGEKALQNIKKEGPDLVILDLYLDCGMNGIQVALEIRKTSNIPIIFITGIDIKEVEKEIVNIENTAILIKPFEPNDLLETIKRSLNQ